MARANTAPLRGFASWWSAVRVGRWGVCIVGEAALVSGGGIQA
jgi:hypothetical protein